MQLEEEKPFGFVGVEMMRDLPEKVWEICHCHLQRFEKRHCPSCCSSGGGGRVANTRPENGFGRGRSLEETKGSGVCRHWSEKTTGASFSVFPHRCQSQSRSRKKNRIPSSLHAGEALSELEEKHLRCLPLSPLSHPFARGGRVFFLVSTKS
ncbi:hypothetical protein MRB53_016996 [Persea americana]|uniref:Uncharacterized protein n=1 Tax=Persea americana TaxID=3435 RepID=A0ACC2M3F6_PERAE|nr:hypothetical protein MRB53_016996 [Persea americana]